LAKIEAELVAAVSVRASLVSDVDKHGAIEVTLRKRVSELESLLEEQRSIDDQRKRNMDRLLSDLGKLETSNSAIVAANKSLEQRLAAASAAPAVVDVPAGADPALAQDLANLQQAYQLSQAETQAQQTRVAELEAKLAAGAGDDLLATVAPPSLDLGTADATVGVEAALVAARQQWAVEADALQTQLAEQTAAQTELAAEHAACGGAPKELAELKSQRAKLVRENEGLRKKIVNVRDTDLFKQIEKASVVLRDKVVKIEEERQRLETQVEKIEKQLRGQERELRTAKSELNRSTADLRAASDREGEHRTLIEKLMIQMPELEQDIVRLQDSLSQKETLLVERSRALETLKVEMEKREHRLLKAQRTAQILEDAREDVVHTNDREKRDMHYNMAMVYSREKRHAEAEGEYLKALRLDPTDADIHYNLAILYDDELESPEKAVLHYKRYLKLSPHGPDADAVRSWLMKLEVK
jgi:tetratricopeptide (TPR) repeat protein